MILAPHGFMASAGLAPWDELVLAASPRGFYDMAFAGNPAGLIDRSPNNDDAPLYFERPDGSGDLMQIRHSADKRLFCQAPASLLNNSSHRFVLFRVLSGNLPPATSPGFRVLAQRVNGGFDEYLDISTQSGNGEVKWSSSSLSNFSIGAPWTEGYHLVDFNFSGGLLSVWVDGVNYLNAVSATKINYDTSSNNLAIGRHMAAGSWFDTTGDFDIRAIVEFAPTLDTTAAANIRAAIVDQFSIA